MTSNPKKKTKGLLLINVGTPDGTSPEQVKRYLAEFLMDPYVVDVPYVIRWLIVHGSVLRSRPAASAEAYQKIWTERGSPLKVASEELARLVQEDLGDEWMVEYAMRYQSPSIRQVLERFHARGVFDIEVLPLYPQYSLAATETSIQWSMKQAKEVDSKMKLYFRKPFFDQSFFIESFVKNVQKAINEYAYDHILFSFHGLPERQVKKVNASINECLSQEGCCSKMNDRNRDCYRAQSFETARLIAHSLGLDPMDYSVGFQSRLGRTPWIRPYTDDLYRELAVRGVKKLLVVCPAFVADCLETLEEIQMRGREEFMGHGGEDLMLVPSLNAEPHWVRGVSSWVRQGHG